MITAEEGRKQSGKVVGGANCYCIDKKFDVSIEDGLLCDYVRARTNASSSSLLALSN